MSQSNVIFGAVFVGFIVFITMRGKLPRYLDTLLGTNAPSGSSGGATSVGGKIAGAAMTLAPYGGSQSVIGGVVSSILGK